MYRIIASLGVGNGSGVFGLSKALHSTPRRYWELTKAITAAKKRGRGTYEIQDDERHIKAIVKDGKELMVDKIKVAA